MGGTKYMAGAAVLIEENGKSWANEGHQAKFELQLPAPDSTLPGNIPRKKTAF
jgi:hypothetical protein